MANRKTSGRLYPIRGAGKNGNAPRKRSPRVIAAIVVIVLVAAAILYLFVGNRDNMTIVENATGTIFTPLQNAFNSATTAVKNFFTDWHSYGKLKDEYELQSLELDQARMELVNAEEAIRENDRLKQLLDARSSYDSLDPIYARVVARDAGTWFKTFTVNRGSSNGVGVGMAVVTGDGLVGRVTNVGVNYAKVITIIDSRSAVACLIQRTRDNGVLRGQLEGSYGTNECNVSYLPDINSISPGDVVVTSGTDSLYPKGIKIGAVTAVSLEASSDGTYAVVTPSADFHHIEEVLILRTVIEKDPDNLPVVATPVAEYQAEVTPRPNSKATPTPEPEQDVFRDTWSRPTNTPAPGQQDPYAGYKVSKLIEDDWAAGVIAK